MQILAALALLLAAVSGLPASRPARLGAYLEEHARLLARARRLVRESEEAPRSAGVSAWGRIRQELALAPTRFVLPATAASLCGSAAEMLRPVLQGSLLDLAATGRSPLWPLLRRLGVLNGVLWAAAILSSTLFARARWRLVMAGRARLLRAALEGEGAALGGRSAGELVGRLERDTEKLADVSLHGAERLLAGATAAAFSLGAMARIEPRLALVGVLLRSPLTLGLTRLAAERVGLYGAVQAEALGALDAACSELLEQREAVRLHGVVGQEAARAERLGEEVVRVVDQTVDAETALRFSKLLLEGAQEVVVTALGLGAVRAGRLSVGQYIAFAGFLRLWEKGCEQVLGVCARLAELRTSLAPYFALLDAPRAQGGGAPAARHRAPLAPTACRGALRVRRLAYAYPAAAAAERGAPAEALRGVDLRIAAGSYVAIVGPSGSGKSTLALACAALLRPLRGSVSLDGVPLRELDEGWLRARVAVVCQGARLFDRSLLDNVRLHADATDAQVRAAAAAVGVDEIAAGLPDGYDSWCGEGGCLLSGGQRQRVLLARALLRRPAVLILDEATSQLDARSELLVLTAVERQMAASNGTLVTVTHRLAAARRAPRIVVMERGRVAGDGPHAELAAGCEAYAALLGVGSAES